MTYESDHYEIPSLPMTEPACDCWKRERQVCDVCQGFGDVDTDRENEAVREYNDSCPPNAAWELAAEVVRAIGVDGTEKRADYWRDLQSGCEDRHWRLFYGTLAKLLYDAASDERERIRIQADIQHTDAA